MNTSKWILLGIAAAGLACLPGLRAQQNQTHAQPQQQSDSDMKGMDMGDMQHDANQSPQAARAANDDMSDMHMEMSAHMHMTAARPEAPGDEARAEKIVEQLRPAIEKYKDYHVALNDGFKIFFPNVPQPRYHFTNYSYGLAAQFSFDPTKPTSLLPSRRQASNSPAPWPGSASRRQPPLARTSMPRTERCGTPNRSRYSTTCIGLGPRSTRPGH